MTGQRFRILVDHAQFFIEDETLADSLDWNLATTYQNLQRDHVATKPGGCVVSTMRLSGYTEIEVLLQEAAPDFGLYGWDHIVECGIKIPSGMLSISAPEREGDPSVVRIPIPCGGYRVAVFSGGLDSVQDELDPIGEDHYRLVLWPGNPEGAVVVHRRGFWCCRTGRHPT